MNLAACTLHAVVPSVMITIRQAAAQWRLIGEVLKVSKDKLDCIETDHSSSVDKALEQVFTVWKMNGNPAFVWKTVLKVLASDDIGHKKLAESIHGKLTGEF